MTTESGVERLEALGGMADEVDGAHPAQVEQAQAEEQAQERQGAALDAAAKSWGMIPYSIGGTLAILAPKLRDVYTAEACYAWGQSAQAVAEKYGWDSPGNMPELALAAASLGFAVPSYVAIREQLDAMEAGKATGLWARIGVWWRARKAKAAAAKAAPGDGVGAAVPAAAMAAG